MNEARQRRLNQKEARRLERSYEMNCILDETYVGIEHGEARFAGMTFEEVARDVLKLPGNGGKRNVSIYEFKHPFRHKKP